MKCNNCYVVKKMEIIEQIMRNHMHQPQHFKTLMHLYDEYQILKKNYEVCEHQFETITYEDIKEPL